jgi:hypothetical protein
VSLTYPTKLLDHTLNRVLKADKDFLYFCTIQWCVLINIWSLINQWNFRLDTHTHRPTHPHPHTPKHTHTHPNTQTPKHTHTQNTCFPFTVRTKCKQSLISFSIQLQFYRVLSWLWRSVAVLSPGRFGFASSAVCSETNRQWIGLSLIKWFYRVDIIPQLFRTLSVTHHHHNVKVILATASLCNT